MILVTIMDHYLIFAMLFMQLRGELGYSGADVPRYLGVTNSCVTRFVASGQKPDVDDLIREWGRPFYLYILNLNIQVERTSPFFSGGG